MSKNPLKYNEASTHHLELTSTRHLEQASTRHLERSEAESRDLLLSSGELCRSPLDFARGDEDFARGDGDFARGDGDFAHSQKKIRVPGKIMLSGEYAVLFGERALAFAVDRYLEVYASVSEDGLFHISTDLWKEELVCKSFEEVPENRRNSPLILALRQSQKEFANPPLRIRIESKLDLSAGMGSSSAVILGCCIASSLFSEKDAPLMDIAKLAYTVQKDMQGHASGYDVLTQCVGGLATMRSKANTWPGTWNQSKDLENTFRRWIHPFAGGNGSATGPLLIQTLRYLANETIRKSFLSLSSNLTDAFLHFFETEEWAPLLKANQDHRKVLSRFPHFPKDLAEDLQSLEGCDRTWTFKTTGAGGEDSILLIGKSEDLKHVFEFMKSKQWYALNCGFSSNGISIEDFHGRDI